MNTQFNQNTWQLQEAKAKFSEVVKSAAETPQIITVRGEETAVVISMENYRKFTQPKQTLWEFFQNSPFKDVELDLTRDKSTEMREIDL
jgi:prevent-host-death family protein